MKPLSRSARRASHSESMSVLARTGLAARAFVYLVIGWLAIQIALGHGNHEADQRGAFADIKQHALGTGLSGEDPRLGGPSTTSSSCATS